MKLLLLDMNDSGAAMLNGIAGHGNLKQEF